MGLLIFFINKPVTFLWYILTVISLFFIMVLLDGDGAIVSFPVSVLAYSINYKVYLFWCYFVRYADKNLKIKNISLSCLKPYFEFYWIIISFFFILLSIFVCLTFRFNKSNTIEGITMCFLVITFISYIILRQSIIVAFISEGVRNNVDIKNTTLDSIYVNAREILTNKLINTK